jgi:hypothetical protein
LGTSRAMEKVRRVSDDRRSITDQIFLVAYFLKRLPWRLVGNPEWSENWAAFPHCNGQNRCWMHSSINAWCECRCGWCRVARVVRRHDGPFIEICGHPADCDGFDVCCDRPEQHGEAK